MKVLELVKELTKDIITAGDNGVDIQQWSVRFEGGQGDPLWTEVNREHHEVVIHTGGGF